MENIERVTNKKIMGWRMKNLDIYGGSLMLKYKGEDTYQTKYGACVTIGLAILLLLVSYYYMEEFTSSQNPNINQQFKRDKNNLSGDLSSANGKNLKFFFTVQHTLINDYYKLASLQQSFDQTVRLRSYTVEIDLDGKVSQLNQVQTDVAIAQCKDVTWFINMDKTTWNSDSIFLISNFGICIDIDSIPLEQIEPGTYTNLDMVVGPCTGSACTNELQPSDMRFRFIINEPQFAQSDEQVPFSMNLNKDNEFNLGQYYMKVIKMYLNTMIVTTTDSKILNTMSSSTVVEEFGLEKLEWYDIDRTNTGDPYMYFLLQPSNEVISVDRTYVTVIDLFSNIGGFMEVLSWIALIMYSGWYNEYFFNKTLVLDGILCNDEEYPNKMKVRDDYNKIKFVDKFSCCCKKKHPDLTEKKDTIDAIDNILEDRLDMVNFLQDSMEYQVIRRLLLKARHQVLVPLLSVSMEMEHMKNKEKRKKMKQKSKKKGGENTPSEKIIERDEPDDSNKVHQLVLGKNMTVCDKEIVNTSNVVVNPIDPKNIEIDQKNPNFEKNFDIPNYDTPNLTTPFQKHISDGVPEDLPDEPKEVSEVIPDEIPEHGGGDNQIELQDIFTKHANMGNGQSNAMNVNHPNKNTKSSMKVVFQKQKTLMREMNVKNAYISLHNNLANNTLEELVDQFFIDNQPLEIIKDYEREMMIATATVMKNKSDEHKVIFDYNDEQENVSNPAYIVCDDTVHNDTIGEGLKARLNSNNNTFNSRQGTYEIKEDLDINNVEENPGGNPHLLMNFVFDKNQRGGLTNNDQNENKVRTSFGPKNHTNPTGHDKDQRGVRFENDYNDNSMNNG